MDIGRISSQNTSGLSSKGSMIKKDTSATIDTSDKLQKSEGPSFFSKVKSFVRENITGVNKSKKQEHQKKPGEKAANPQ